MSSATLPTVGSRSLLSRIGPPASSERLTVNTPAKRKISVEEQARPTKKQALSGEQRRVDQRIGFSPWLNSNESIDVDASYEERMHDELVRFVDYISPSRQERKARAMIVARIEELLKARWPDAQVIVFGSSATGLDLTGGDIDLVVGFGAAYQLSDVEKKRRLAAIGDVLRRSGLTTWVNRIFGARVPIITFATTEELGEISVDISIRNDEDAGPRAIPLIKQFLVDLPALKPLILAVKAFLSLQDLNDASQSTLSSYAITLLCISFLQRNPTRRPQKSLDEPLAEKSLGILLMDFFRHYGHDFSYATHYISVSGRDIFLKAEINWIPKANNPAVLAVQCMLNPESNITRGCGKISLIVQAFKQAHRVLQETPLSNGKGTTSLLCRIYEISVEDDARRCVLDNSVDSGSFSGHLDATAGDLSSRAVSGGVQLGPRSGDNKSTNYNRDASRPLPRFATGPTRGNGAPYASHARRNNTNSYRPGTQQTIQQLPVLRWQDNRNQRQSKTPPINMQFHFDSQSELFRSLQSAHTSAQGRMPVYSGDLYQGHSRNYNSNPRKNSEHPNYNHQQSQGAGQSYHAYGRH